MAKVIIEPKDAQNVKTLVRVALENELKILKAGVAITYRKLEGLEKNYGMSSKQFYDKFKKGEMGDGFEYHKNRLYPCLILKYSHVDSLVYEHLKPE